jgi:glutaredoxin
MWLMVMPRKKVRLFIKPYCGWCRQATDWLSQRGIEFETIDVTAQPDAFAEMRRLSGQSLAPVIDVEGRILADFGARELAEWWRQLA